MRGDKAILAKLSRRPSVKARLWALVPSEWDRRFLASVLAEVPAFLAHRFLDEYEARARGQGWRAANLYAFELRDKLLPELLPENRLPFDATDDDIAEAATRAAKRVKGMQRPGITEGELLSRLGRMARRYCVDMPTCRRAAGVVARMREPSWWRRALRKRFRRVEHAAIIAGCVHRRASPYLSDEARRRFDRHEKRTAELLAALEAVNLDTGEVLSLEELAAASLSNPANRRAAMMVCIRGLEAHATERGLRGLFITITCPGRMHARYAASGEANPHYDRARSPQDAQRYLCKVWNSATRKIAREGIAYCGLRTVEPHHDGTPHWHLVVFVDPDRADRFAEILREYTLRDAPDEPGAGERRCTIKCIDPAKGNATAYVAAYVSKNIDGHGVEEDVEAGKPASEGARRAVAWSRLWGIRQFQFFGAGALTPYRELYRLEHMAPALEPILSEVWRAVRAKDYRAFLAARDARGIRLGVLYEPTPSTKYPGEEARRLRGVLCRGDAGDVPIVTRPDAWAVQFRPAGDIAKRTDGALSHRAARAPWTRFNNSAHIDRQGVFSVSDTHDMSSRWVFDAGCASPESRRHATSPPRAVPGGKSRLRSEIWKGESAPAGHRYPARA